jgi:uncharacterized hydrophobic protein (TIGR00271 family)
MVYLFQKIFDLQSTSDKSGSIERISEGVSIRGYNIWLLFCSAVLASIGLDTNSTAVIIGAMLISPLMSPILGIGLSLGIHDNQLLWRSSKNLLIAVILSLIASVLYFLISPFGEPTAEIEARTFPTLLDVMVALFGGIAGIISTSRSGPSIALPGVAIATALMPPLCTVGYGIATQQWHFFAGAFYLFFINAVFISLATFLIVKYLKFPEKVYRTTRQQRIYNVLFLTLIIIVTIPSIYFLIGVYQKETVRKKINNIVLKNIYNQGNEILKWELEKKDSATLIKVYHSGLPIPDSLKNDISHQLVLNGIKGYQLVLHRVNMTKEEVNELSSGVIRNMFQQMELKMLNSQKDARQADTLSYQQVIQETKIAFNFIDTATNGWLSIPDTSGSIRHIPAFFYKFNQPVERKEFDQLYKFLKVRFSADSVVMIKL